MCAIAAQPRCGSKPRYRLRVKTRKSGVHLPLLQRKHACTSRRLRVMAPSGPTCMHLAMRIPGLLTILLVVLVSTVLDAGAGGASPERDKASPPEAKVAAIPEIEFYL